MKDDDELARLMRALLSKSKDWELRYNDVLKGYHFIVNSEILIDSIHAAAITRFTEGLNK